MAKKRLPTTPAVRVLRERGIAFTLHTYAYEEKGGTRVAARELGVDEHRVIKTLVMESGKENPFLVLMHGDREVSTRALARRLHVKTVAPCAAKTAQQHTGYQVGGISPFGTRKRMKVYVEETVLELPEIFINAGKRGLMAQIPPRTLTEVLDAVPVRTAR